MHPAFDESAMADDYQMLEELGSGSFGVVYKAIERSTGDLVAIKHIDLEGNDDDIREIQQEISLLSTCSSEYVTRYKASFVRGVKLWIVMEYLGGGSCLDLLKRGPFNEAQIAVVMRELLQGLDYLHATGKIHRDIKAANVLLSTTGHVKLADFGVAAQLTNIKSQRMTFVGTPFWMAPEVIQEAGYDFRADIWSLGITAMELAQGEPPHSDVHPMKVLFLIPKQPAPRLDEGQWSKDFRDFVTACLSKDPDKRPTAKALLKHRFIQKAGRLDVLRNLVVKAQKLEQARDRGDRVKYYEETLRGLPQAENEDDWVFDTIKPVARQMTAKHGRRKLSRIPSDELQDETSEAMERLDIKMAPLVGSPPDSVRPKRPSSTIQTPQAQTVTPDQRRRSSALTARRVSPKVRKISRESSRAMPTIRRVSNQPRQALELDKPLGNGTSTVRQFQRAPSASHMEVPTQMQISASMPQLPGMHTPPDSDAENKSYIKLQKVAPVVPATKEATLGRRAFAKAIEPALHDSLAHSREVQHVADAWTALDERDPETSLMVLQAIISRVQADPKLAARLMPQHIVDKQLASLRLAKSPRKISASHNRPRNGMSAESPASSPVKTSTPSASPTKAAHAQRVSQPGTPRRKQSQLSNAEERRMAAKMPGHVEQGQEHVAMLADVLYVRWCEDLCARWT